MKHIGRLQPVGAKVIVLFREVPNEPQNCLVVETKTLGDLYEQDVLELIATEQAQAANDLADFLALRKLRDGSNALAFLHQGGPGGRGFITKVATENVELTPNPATAHKLSEVNKLIREAKAKSDEVLAAQIKVETANVAANKARAAELVAEARTFQEKANHNFQEAYKLDPEIRPKRAYAPRRPRVQG